jgi:hypothetical protein
VLHLKRLWDLFETHWPRLVVGGVPPDLLGTGDVGCGLLCFGSIRVASLVTRGFRSEEAAMRSNKVTIIWGILTLISLLVVLVLMLLGVVSL